MYFNDKNAFRFEIIKNNMMRVRKTSIKFSIPFFFGSSAGRLMFRRLELWAIDRCGSRFRTRFWWSSWLCWRSSIRCMVLLMVCWSLGWRATSGRMTFSMLRFGWIPLRFGRFPWSTSAMLSCRWFTRCAWSFWCRRWWRGWMRSSQCWG